MKNILIDIFVITFPSMLLHSQLQHFNAFCNTPKNKHDRVQHTNGEKHFPNLADLYTYIYTFVRIFLLFIRTHKQASADDHHRCFCCSCCVPYTQHTDSHCVSVKLHLNANIFDNIYLFCHTTGMWAVSKQVSFK